MTNTFSGAESVSGSVEEDFIGGGGVKETDLYPGTIKAAYAQGSNSSKAQSVVLLITLAGGHEHREQIWCSNKVGKVTYKSSKTGKEENLPGFNQMNSLAMLTCSKELGQLEVEEKTLNLWDFDANKQIPQAVECYHELHGKNVVIALQKQIVDKTVENKSTGVYEPNGETRSVNQIVKFFAEEPVVTISEVEKFIKSLGGNLNDVLEDGDIDKAISKMSDEHGGYAQTWLAKNQGETYDRSTGKKGGAGKEFKSSSKGSGEDSDKPKASLFDD